ncbi:TLC domain-containing protein 3A isoform X3 [Xenopus laevis]|uniref:TLC domain-containing protein 3A isoform X3 n=1 Tax=Xenopus laevis TaxID=8355 RepID=A0A8J0UI47_XENLA|nr:TLC domain-containing protein 3A isoform X3 [Xenopus laevis]
MWHVLAAGSFFFPGLYLLCSQCARRTLPKWTEADCSLLSTRIVSSVQGFLAASSGIIVITSCKDVKFDRCYDKQILNGKDHFATAMDSFLRKDFLMLVHHVVILTILVPIGLFLRSDIGDFFVGCLYVAEMSTPFVSLGKVLIQMNLQNSLLHKVNGALVLITFFLCRILLFPFMYYAYSKQYGIPLYKVPFSIPLHCNVANASIMAPQIYWFWLICKKALRLYRGPARSGKDR